MGYSYLCYLFLLLQSVPEYDSYSIVGGDPVKIEEVPFMAIYKFKKFAYGCGASIVNERFVVSAAHCNFPENNKMEVVVGTDKSGEGQHYAIMASYQHPKFDFMTIDYDVVVLKLAKELVFSSKVQPVKMAGPNTVIDEGSVFSVTGFGKTNPNEVDSDSPVLLQVKVPYVNNVKCNKAYEGIITDRMICAGEEGKDGCYGDSGGPLIYKNTLIGIVSFGNDCGKKGYPGVYTRVTAVRDFIDEMLTK